MLLDKPVGISSHDAVQHVRRSVGQRAVGHTGTLDPLAEGLLVLCLGRGTKIARFLTGFDKTYEAQVCFGQRSATYDAEGVDADTPVQPVPSFGPDDLETLVSDFRGSITQTVPAFSAVRVDGQRLHRAARAGEAVALPTRQIEIKDLTIREYSAPHLQLRVSCSKGTYIRSLAHDLGEKAGCGAYLSYLKRTQVGPFELDQAMSQEQVEEYHANGSLASRLLGFQEALGFSSIVVSDGFRESILTGRDLHASDVVDVDGAFLRSDRVLLRDGDGTALAVGVAELAANEIRQAGEQKVFTYTRVLN
jgi:tRNA pseudouridine55 synthase